MAKDDGEAMVGGCGKKNEELTALPERNANWVSDLETLRQMDPKGWPKDVPEPVFHTDEIYVLPPTLYEGFCCGCIRGGDHSLTEEPPGCWPRLFGLDRSYVHRHCDGSLMMEERAPEDRNCPVDLVWRFEEPGWWAKTLYCLFGPMCVNVRRHY